MTAPAQLGRARAAGVLLTFALSAGALSAQQPPATTPAAPPPPVAAAPIPATVSASQGSPSSAASSASSAASSPAGAAAPLRLTAAPSVRVETLPPENPFGLAAESPAALPPKPAFIEQVVDVPLYAAIHVDRTGKPLGSRRPRDPIPSLSADQKKSFDRWVFEPARKAGQPVETWASFRLDLHVELKAPKIEQIALMPVLPSSPLPVPFEWGADQAWYDAVKAASPADGTIPIEQVDTLAVPKKTKWDADSFKGPFSLRMWVRITAAGRAERIVPIQASDPVLLADIRKQISTWQFRPARANGQAVDSWNELTVAGQIGYSVDVKQIANLRKTLPDADAKR